MIWSYCPVDRQDDGMTGFRGSEIDPPYLVTLRRRRGRRRIMRGGGGSAAADLDGTAGGDLREAADEARRRRADGDRKYAQIHESLVQHPYGRAWRHSLPDCLIKVIVYRCISPHSPHSPPQAWAMAHGKRLPLAGDRAKASCFRILVHAETPPHLQQLSRLRKLS